LRLRARGAQSARSAALNARKEEPMATRRLPDASNPAEPAADAVRGPVRTRKSAAAVPARVQVTPEARHALIAQSAYLRAERRGFTPGQEVEDWLAAEAEVDTLLRVELGGSPQ
jgi:Protein of unknown function (DUF2934)